MEHYGTSILRISQSEMKGTPIPWKRSDLEKDLADMEADGKLARGTKAIQAHHGDYNVSSDEASAAMALQYINAKLQENVSFVLKYEYVSASHRPMKWISDALFDFVGIPTSVHLYISAAGARVLKPHTDPYDVIVHQLSGAKRWRTCVPRKEISSASYSASANLSDAQRCLLQELARDSIQGCTQYRCERAHARARNDAVISNRADCHLARRPAQRE